MKDTVRKIFHLFFQEEPFVLMSVKSELLNPVRSYLAIARKYVKV